MGFSFLSWNVRKFKASPGRTKKIVNLIKKYNPDVFGILEFSDKTVAKCRRCQIPMYKENLIDIIKTDFYENCNCVKLPE